MAIRARRQNAAARKEEILRAAVAEIERRGFASTRVADVAGALGVSEALIFYHFSTKDRLLADAFAYTANRDLTRLEGAVRNGESAPDRLRAALGVWLPTGSSPAWRVWIDAWAESLRTPELRKMSRRLDSRWKEAIAAIIDDGVAAGDFRCDDTRTAVWRITALLDGLAMQVTVHRGVLARRQAARWVREQAERELDLAAGQLS